MAQADGAGGGPTALRILLGAQLRRLREAAGVNREQAGWEIRGSDSKITRLERGKVGFKQRDVEDLLTLYGVTDPADREPLLELARNANTPGWWHRFSDLLPTWFQPYLGLESAAESIRTYEVQFVPGLLQTPDYARAVVRISYGSAPAEEIERRVALRVQRQHVLTRTAPLHLWAVIDEAVLRRWIGGPAVMRGQVAALIDAAKLPNVHVQVLRFAAGGHAAVGGAFALLRFPDADLPDVAYVELLTGAIYLDKRDDIDEYTAAMGRLSIEAETPARSLAFLEGLLRDLDAQET